MLAIHRNIWTVSTIGDNNTSVTVIRVNLIFTPNWHMNNYKVRSYRDVIVLTKFAITKYAIRRASKAQSTVMY